MYRSSTKEQTKISYGSGVRITMQLSTWWSLLIHRETIFQENNFGHDNKMLILINNLLFSSYAVDLVVCCALGVDMFDCVYPTRTAVSTANVTVQA